MNDEKSGEAVRASGVRSSIGSTSLVCTGYGNRAQRNIATRDILGSLDGMAEYPEEADAIDEDRDQRELSELLSDTIDSGEDEMDNAEACDGRREQI